MKFLNPIFINFFIIFHKFIFIYVKMSKTLSAKYYQENKERLQKKAREVYQNLSKDEKEKKWEYGCERFKNLSENEQLKFVEYRKKYYRARKNASL